MGAYSEDDFLPLSGIQHMAFCERQWALIHIEQQWAENVRTMEGRLLHEKADDPFYKEFRGNLIIARSVPLSSKELGLYGVVDVVEFWRASPYERGVSLTDYKGLWVPHPVEYKRGKPKVDDRDRVQLCAQAICLEEMYGIPIDSGSIFYWEPRRREKVHFNKELRSLVKYLAIRMHEMFLTGTTPPGIVAKHCKQCSLVDICVPEMVKNRKSASQYIKDFLKEKVVNTSENSL